MRFLSVLLILLGVAMVISGPGAADLLGGGLPLIIIFILAGTCIGIAGGVLLDKHDR